MAISGDISGCSVMLVRRLMAISLVAISCDITVHYITLVTALAAILGHQW